MGKAEILKSEMFIKCGNESIDLQQNSSHATTKATELTQKEANQTLKEMKKSEVWKELSNSDRKYFISVMGNAREQLFKSGAFINKDEDPFWMLGTRVNTNYHTPKDTTYGYGMALGIAHSLKCHANVTFEMPNFEKITLGGLIQYRVNVQLWTNQMERKTLANFEKKWPSKNKSLTMPLLNEVERLRGLLVRAHESGKINGPLDSILMKTIDFKRALKDPKYALSILNAIQRHLGWKYLENLNISEFGLDGSLQALTTFLRDGVQLFLERTGLPEKEEDGPKVFHSLSTNISRYQSPRKTMKKICKFLKEGTSVKFCPINIITKERGLYGNEEWVKGYELEIGFRGKGKVIMQFFGEEAQLAKKLAKLKRKDRVAFVVKYLMKKMKDKKQEDLRMITWQKRRGERAQIYGGKFESKSPEGMTNVVKLALYLEFFTKNRRARRFYSKEKNLEMAKKICDLGFGAHAPLIVPREMTPETAYLLMHAIAGQQKWRKQDGIASQVILETIEEQRISSL